MVLGREIIASGVDGIAAPLFCDRLHRTRRPHLGLAAGGAVIAGASTTAAPPALMLGTFGDAGAVGTLAAGATVALSAAFVSALRLRAPRPTLEATLPAVGREVTT